VIKLHDVAELAGVSMSTVSRVANGSGLVSAPTRERVERAMKSLDYQPSRVARRLRRERGKAHLLGLIIPDIQNPFFADLARGVEDVARQQGYMVLFGNSDEDPIAETLHLDLMRAESVDGVILPPTADRQHAAAATARGALPVVCVDRRPSRVTLDTVVTDNLRGAYEAVDHLIRLGHHRIAFIGGRPRLSTTEERLEGYLRALRDHDIAPIDALVSGGHSREAGGRHAAEALLALPEPPTAMFVGNNLMTLGALEAIHGRGLRIPDDVAIIGFDDMPWALALNPPLTAVRQLGYEMGRRAVELLLQRIEDPRRSTTLVVLQPELIVRKSCGAGLKRRQRSRRLRAANVANSTDLPPLRPERIGM
jgi:DNA-binding LacI/PurR family transcriptional regulator